MLKPRGKFTPASNTEDDNKRHQHCVDFQHAEQAQPDRASGDLVAEVAGFGAEKVGEDVFLNLCCLAERGLAMVHRCSILRHCRCISGPC